MKKCPYCAEEIQDAAIVCKHCGRDLQSGASQVQLLPPKRKTSPAAWGCLTIIVILGVLTLIGQCSNNARRAAQAPEPAPSVSGPVARADGDQAQALIDRFGKPDDDESSETERPRPPIVTRMLTYRKEGVRAIFRADIPFASKERVAGRWRLVGYTDPTPNVGISQDTAFRRLAGRK
jgi:hypothetical protein